MQGAEEACPGQGRDRILVSQEHVQAQYCLCTRFTSCPDLAISHLTPRDRCPPNIPRTFLLMPCPFAAWDGGGQWTCIFRASGIGHGMNVWFGFVNCKTGEIPLLWWVGSQYPQAESWPYGC